jgi:hypothetical protein
VAAAQAGVEAVAQLDVEKVAVRASIDEAASELVDRQVAAGLIERRRCGKMRREEGGGEGLGGARWPVTVICGAS